MIVRLNNNGLNSNITGRVEIFYNQNWGTVCNKNPNRRLVARTVCKQLGMVDGIILPKPNRFGNATGPILLRDVECTSGTDSIFKCSHSEWGDYGDCDHSHDLEVFCYANGKEILRICYTSSSSLMLLN